MSSDERRERIHRALIEWYEANRRALPWRETRDPYRILVSEVMLQQTQADRVTPKYEEFLSRFPTLQSLAEASTADVIRAWAGLGYNRRALNLQRACRVVVEHHGGVMPSDVETLMTLPGIGRYTAGAVACFAHGAEVAFVDTNIRRVLHRVEAGPEVPAPKLSESEVMTLAIDMLPTDEAYAWNQGLMELGATICRARHAACDACPLRSDCRARPVIQEALAASPRRSVNAERFERTSRFARGRIVAALRDAPTGGLTLEQIARVVAPEGTDTDREWIASHMDGLVRDGLAMVTDAIARESSPPYDGELSSDQWGPVRYTLPS